jgi:spore maturation protein CgeB/glycosyltransferase involved in cell wall biosynthesis
MKKIWLYYVSYPVTTAVYFERALRKKHDVVTVGPSLPESFISQWNLENMKLPILPQDIPTDFEPDILALYNATEDDKKPEMFIWIESVGYILPKNIASLPIPTASYWIDSHLHLKDHVELAKNFDYVFIAQKEYVEDYKKAGNKNVFWLPLGADPEIHDKFSSGKVHEIGFVGSVPPDSRRSRLLNKLMANLPLSKARIFWTEMSKFFSESKIVFNNAIRNDLNMRFFEAMSTGTFLLSDVTNNSGQKELFIDGEDYASYDDGLIENVAQFYLENDELREAIAKRGMELIRNAHKYSDRTDEMVDVTAGVKTRTSTAEELRQKSVQFVSVSSSKVNKLKRSFVIPVIDYAPASQYNIKTLLDDLEKVEGEVIVVFNSEQVADELKDDPRIDYYAIMKKNVGVSRAWNIGLNIARTPIVFFINSDVHVEKETIMDIEKVIISFPDAAMVGPQGSFFHFEELIDLHYFDKNKFSTIQEVDAVSGFLFGIRKKYFDQYNFRFENDFTPCYYEEWDIGLQIKKAGLKSYVVPSFKYDHEWSGSIKSMEKISYYDKAETSLDIYTRNKTVFKSKWKRIAQQEENGSMLLVSGWVNFALHLSKDAITNNRLDLVEPMFNRIIELYPELAIGYKNLGVLYYSQGNINEAFELLKKANKIDPVDEFVKKYLEEIKLKLGD